MRPSVVDDEPRPERAERPHNPHRIAFHVGSGLFALGLIAFIPVEWLKWVSGAFAGTFWSFEITRRIWPRWNDWLQRFFRLIARPRERFVITSSTWYTTALVLLSCTHDRVLCTIGVAVLAIGDPVAALVGRKWGRIRLPLSRTLEGSFAFVVAASVFAWAMLQAITPQLAAAHALPMAAAAAVAGATAEALSRRIDDNITIPLTAAAAAWAVRALVVG